MKRFQALFLALLLTLMSALSVESKAWQYANVTNTAAATAQCFRTGNTAFSLSTASTYVGANKLVRRLLLYPNVSSGAALTTFELWDAPGGLTYSAGAVQVLNLFGLQPNVTTGPYVVDFRCGDANSSDVNYSQSNGRKFLYVPTVITSGTNTPVAQMEYAPATKNVTFP